MSLHNLRTSQSRLVQFSHMNATDVGHPLFPLPLERRSRRSVIGPTRRSTISHRSPTGTLWNRLGGQPSLTSIMAITTARQPAAHSCGWCCCSRIFLPLQSTTTSNYKRPVSADAGDTFAGDLRMHLCVVVVASHL